MAETEIAPPEPRTYEGHVKYADGSVMSVQCAEDRHGDCPDDHDNDEGTGCLEGYNCECGCAGVGDDRPLTVLLRRCKELEKPDGSWPGGDIVQMLCEFLTGYGYDIEAAAPEGTAR